MSRLARAGAPLAAGALSRLALTVVLLAALAAAGCGQHGVPGAQAADDLAMPVLAASAVPGIPSVTAQLTVAELAKDAPIRGLAAKITSWGYRDGRMRTFQGESHHLTLVVSRALAFRNAAGARQYVAFVRAHESAFFGSFTQTRNLRGPGVSGWLFAPPLCACHLANPALTGILDAGSRVTWLEINGPAATQRLLLRLLDSLRGVPAARLG
jgi:hypothetical protein